MIHTAVLVLKFLINLRFKQLGDIPNSKNIRYRLDTYTSPNFAKIYFRRVDYPSFWPFWDYPTLYPMSMPITLKCGNLPYCGSIAFMNQLFNMVIPSRSCACTRNLLKISFGHTATSVTSCTQEWHSKLIF